MAKPRSKSPRRDKALIKHYLLTVPVGANLHLHSYVMTDDTRCIAVAMDKMVTIAEEIAKSSGIRLLPIFLQTELDSGVNIVREVLGRIDKRAKEMMEKATDFHMSMFGMEADSSDDLRLMELH